MTFTGRTTIWAYVPEALSHKPLAGYGYASTTFGNFIIEIYRAMGITNPHNGYINLALSVGLIGLTIFLASLFSSLRVGRRLYTLHSAMRDGGLVVSGVLVAWMISMLSESQDKPLGPMAAFGFTAMGILVYREHGLATAPSGLGNDPASGPT
jgi:O-antigen ligase